MDNNHKEWRGLSQSYLLNVKNAFPFISFFFGKLSSLFSYLCTLKQVFIKSSSLRMLNEDYVDKKRGS